MSFVVLEDVTETQVLQQELIHSARLASIGSLAAGVAHEIGNPVTGIDCLAQNLAAETEEEITRDHAKQIIVLTHRIGTIVQALANFAHTGVFSSGERSSVELCSCVDEAIYLLNLDRNARRVNFDNRCAGHLRVLADPQRLLQVCVNLLNNARDAVEEDATITVVGTAGEPMICLSITDDGCGIPGDCLEHVFEPFFTTKSPGEGSGLGLSLVYAIIRDMQGDVQIESPIDEATGRGTRVTVRLPQAPRP